MFKINNSPSILLLSGFLLLFSKAHASTNDDFLSGFKAGFLNGTPKKVMKKSPAMESNKRYSENIVPTSSTALIHIESPYRSKTIDIFPPNDHPENQRTMWEDPSLDGPQACTQICKFVTEMHVGDHYDEMEDYLKRLLSPNKELSEPACLSHSLFYKFLEFYHMFNYYSWLKGIKMPDSLGGPVNKLPYIMQALANRVIQMRFYYMNTLDFEAKDKFRENFLLVGSNNDQGEFVFSTKVHTLKKSHIKPAVRVNPDEGYKELFQFRYFSQMTVNQKKIYRLYLLDNNSGPIFQTAISVPNHPSIGCYHPPCNEFTHNLEEKEKDGFYRGFLLDKKGRPIETPGIIITTKELNDLENKDKFVFVYAKDPFFDQMCFYEQFAIKAEENLPSFPLLDMVGGIEALNRDKILFLPYSSKDTNSEIHPLYAEFLLPYAQCLYLEWAESGQPTEPVKSLIEKLETCLVEDALGNDDPAFVQQCALEIASEQIENLLNQKDRDLEKTLKEKSDIIFKIYEKPAQPGKNWKKNKRSNAKKASIEAVKKETAATLSIEVIQKRRKKKILEAIRTKYIDEASKKSHFKTKEANEILDQMRAELSRIGIKDTKIEQIRGSHVGKEIINTATGASTHLSKANRPQKIGYGGGTLRKIIEQQISNVMLILPERK